MTELLCPADGAPKRSDAALCKVCMARVPWHIRAPLWNAQRNLQRHPHEAGARARVRAAAVDVVKYAKRAAVSEPTPPLTPAS